jgi:hypothetical protein
MDRRSFLKTTGAATATLALARRASCTCDLTLLKQSP